MKPVRQVAAVGATALALALLGGLGGGCASRSAGGSTPKPGSGIADYRQLTGDAHRSVAAVVKSLEVLTQPSTLTSPLHPGLADLDRAVQDLELTSIRARARAEAILARGQVYFDEWKEHLGASTDPAATRTESERYARLFEHFGRVRERSGAVREHFRPFMTKLREYRARFDRPPASAAGSSSREALDSLIANGRSVLQALESVSTALDEAGREVRTTTQVAR